MKKRYLYSLLFGVPGLAVTLLIALFLCGALAGLLWLYVFGDNPWPLTAERLLPAVFLFTFLVLWMATIVAGYRTGKRLEDTPGLDRHHVLAAAGATALPVALLLLHQLGVGNIGPKSATVRCGEFCSDHGYAGSAMPPRDSGDTTCRCFDSSGRPVISKSLAPGSIE
jgi:hypothetical protein